MQTERQVPIWFFIGALLLVYGILITGWGLCSVAFPPPKAAQVALYEYHADIWWGALLVMFGAFYTIRFRPRGDASAG